MKHVNKLIVGGRDAQQDEFPHMVSPAQGLPWTSVSITTFLFISIIPFCSVLY
jgi:hypothetical protein